MNRTTKQFLSSHQAALLLTLLIVTFIPFLGETWFNTKGEPREAVVALSMINSGNWILPVSNGCDIPYKPPMLAWIIALFSELGGGEVTEFTSRLPSALAMIIMVMAGYGYCARYRGRSIAMMMALITMTSFEVHRAATNCRVDMLLTMFMVTAMYRLMDRYERKGTLIDITAALLLSGAVLTKGPVGAVLPLMVMWVYVALSGKNMWKPTLQCAIVMILSLILPAAWYYAAYRMGGHEFYNLVMEENFGRFTGTMSYESHENPWWYNIVTVVAGMLPYTLLFILSAGMVRHIKLIKSLSVLRQKIRTANRWTLFMTVVTVVVFIFYCIPKSKRSVYLLPIYPMLAYATTVYL
ncbi:MAG: glycosyltransferase family 39 protein, partial [Clostridium sp.]|nr:glycosyltransferase family 39 protein [Clostridium sp.]